jgi:hypothetical protein
MIKKSIPRAILWDHTYIPQDTVLPIFLAGPPTTNRISEQMMLAAATPTSQLVHMAHLAAVTCT